MEALIIRINMFQNVGWVAGLAVEVLFIGLEKTRERRGLQPQATS
ncbi:hypothetical protein TCELL_0164 [Thermogladius calderae 1633]|uniref:Uncharacterized protein n=1 Tax=Thermogladius calderae (strain DSM 22663 / VKM B-2946 / 1633) TaxID=1184251 RepID=I3TCV1_THEC1|nr:hypothetical protein TCELL_0164 [Thermogladius calderae 1633]